MIPPGCSRGLLDVFIFFFQKPSRCVVQYNTCTATASVSSTKCSSSEWSCACTVVQFSCTQAYVILLQQGQFALRSITSLDIHEQDWQRHPADPYRTLLKVLTIHTYLVHEGRNKLPVSRTFPCLTDPEERDWPLCKVVFLGWRPILNDSIDLHRNTHA